MEISPTKNNAAHEEYDELNIRNDPGFKKKLRSDEKVLLSTIALKFNKRGKRQERTLLVTTKAIYNISRQNILTQAISWISSSLSIKRKIDITKLTGVTVSDISGEFVLHVPDEYDYRYSSAERRDRILQMICRSYYMNVTNRFLLFYFKEQVELGDYTTTEDDKRRGLSRVPKGKGQDLDEEGMRMKSVEYRKAIEKMRKETQSVFTKTSIKVTLADFELLRVLGRGAFGKVMLVKKKDDKKIYALKSIRKEEIIDKDQVEHTKTERYVLEKNSCPFLVNLEFAFQTPEKIFFVMKFMRGGELFQHLKVAKRFDENRAKFYTAEIILALEYLHNLDVVYRDLKPENILLDEEGHIALADFGMAKRLKKDELTYSFVGTPEYLSPEMVDNVGHSFVSDWWSLGIFVFEMMIGLPPFYNREGDHDLMFKAIKEKEVNFGSKVQISNHAKDLINNFLIKDPKKRLGANGTREIKAHPWFSDIDWKALNAKKITPPFKPRVVSDIDVANFDEEFTKEEAFSSVISNADMNLINKYQNEFENFSFGPTAMIRTSLLSHGRTESEASAGLKDSVLSKGIKDSIVSTDFHDSVLSIPEEKEEEDAMK